MKKRLILIAAAALTCQGCWFSISGGDFGVIYKGAVDRGGPGAAMRPVPACSTGGLSNETVGSASDPALRGTDFS